MKQFANKKSFALVIALPILCLVILSCTTLLVIGGNDVFLAYAKCNSMRAYCIADAGIADGYAQLRAGGQTPSLASFSQDYNVSGANDAGSYSVSFQLDDAGQWPIYTVTSVGTYKGVSRTLQLKVQLTSFQHWAYITNTEICYYPGWEGYASYWVTGNIVNGPVQVNDHLYIAGNPLFNGTVSVADTSVTYYDAPGVDNPQFNGGLWLAVRPVPLPDPAPLLTAISSAASQPGAGLFIDGTYLDEGGVSRAGLYRGPGGAHTDTSIEFLDDGTMNVTSNGLHRTTTNMPIPSNGAIFVSGGEVDVKGRLNGQVTIGCDQNIWTSDSIIYHDTSPGAPNLDSTDVLGLVAKQNIILPNDLGHADKEVDGYLVALNGSYYLENMVAAPGVLGNLVQYGGIMAQWSATVFGCFSGAGELQFGYLNIPCYDDRLMTLIPPCFTPARDIEGFKYYKISLKEIF